MWAVVAGDRLQGGGCAAGRPGQALLAQGCVAGAFRGAWRPGGVVGRVFLGPTGGERHVGGHDGGDLHWTGGTAWSG